MQASEAIQEILKAVESLSLEEGLNQQQLTFVQAFQKNSKLLHELYQSLPSDNLALSRVASRFESSFRKPITVLHGYSSLFIIRPEDFGADLSPTQRDYMQIIRENCQWLGHWYKTLVDSAQAEIHSEYKTVPQACQLADILRHSETVLAFYLREKPVKISFMIPDNLPPVFAAAFHLMHLIEHIVTVMALELIEYGQIKVSAEQSGTLVNLRIFCTGIGSSTSEIASLFEKNGRAIYRVRFEQYGGRIEFSREAGVGAAVHLLIAIAEN